MLGNNLVLVVEDLSLNLSPGHRNMEGEIWEDKSSAIQVVARDIGVLPTDLPDFMRDRKDTAQRFHFIYTGLPKISQVVRSWKFGWSTDPL